MGRSLKKGPFTDDHLMKKVDALNDEESEDGSENLVAPLDDCAGIYRPHGRGA